MYFLFTDTPIWFSVFYEFYSTKSNFILASTHFFFLETNLPEEHHDRIVSAGVTIFEKRMQVLTCRDGLRVMCGESALHRIC